MGGTGDAAEPLLDDTQRDLGAVVARARRPPKWSAIGLLFPRAGVDGMVNPIGLEVIPNPEVLPFERPFVLAHEWAHLSGAAEESEASFVAWMVCLRGAPDLRYSGWQALLLSLLRAVPPGVRQSVMASLASGPRTTCRPLRRASRTHSPRCSGRAGAFTIATSARIGCRRASPATTRSSSWRWALRPRGRYLP